MVRLPSEPSLAERLLASLDPFGDPRDLCADRLRPLGAPQAELDAPGELGLVLAVPAAVRSHHDVEHVVHVVEAESRSEQRCLEVHVPATEAPLGRPEQEHRVANPRPREREHPVGPPDAIGEAPGPFRVPHLVPGRGVDRELPPSPGLDVQDRSLGGVLDHDRGAGAPDPPVPDLPQGDRGSAGERCRSHAGDPLASRAS